MYLLILRGHLNWKNPKKFSFWPNFSGPPPPLFEKGLYRRKRRYFVPNSNCKVRFFQNFNPPLPYFGKKPNFTDFVNWGGPLLSITNNLNQPFKAWPCMEVQQKNNLKYWNLQVGSSVQNIWWQEELHMVCKGFYAICIFHNSLFVGVNSHFREKHHKISLICYLIWSFYH